nr:uncharacterized protein LOC124810941 [Hydra vulgaris]
MSDEYLILQAKARMKFRAGQTTEPLRNIWNSVLSQSTEAVKKNLKFEAAESIMRNKRRKNLPPIPKNLAEMKEALDNGHPFEDIYQGFVEFEMGRSDSFLQTQNFSLSLKRLKNSSSMPPLKHGLTTISFLNC